MEKADWASTQGQASTPAGDIFGSHTIGQTFIPSHSGMSAVEVLLVDYGLESKRSSAPLEFRLCRDLACQDVVTATILPASSISHNASFRLRCPPQPDSAGRTYTLLVSAPQASGPARATLWAHSADYYPDGSLLRDGQPAPGDLNFWTYYELDSGQLTAAVLQQIGAGLGSVPALLLLLLAPGYLLARLLPCSPEDDVLDLVAHCLALSVAAIPVLLLLLSQLGPLLNGLAVGVGASLIGVLALGLFIRDLRRGRWRGRWRVPAPVAVAFGGILAVGVTLRLVHALDLTGPLWVDAVHHSLLARLILERQAIPGDYLPYVEVAPATYHFGFQSLMAVLHDLTGKSLPDSLLLLGQTLSVLTALPLYALGKRWGGSRWAGLFAAAVPAALSLMPAYYISWSRYTEVAGLLILPVAALLLERWLRLRRWHGGLAGAAAVAIAGLLVTHLRVAAFLVVLAAFMVLEATLQWRYRAIWVPWVRALAVALAAAALTWPWLGPSIQHLWLPAAQSWPASAETLSLYYIQFGLGRYLVPLVAVGAALGLLWRRRETLLLALWVGALPVLANPELVGLQPGGPLERLFPGLHIGAVVDNLAVDIALYVPLSLGAALAVGGLVRFAHWLYHDAHQRGMAIRLGRFAHWVRLKGRGWRWVVAVLAVGVSAWGAYTLREVVNPRTAILTPSDLRAMEWIQQNTAPADVFLINCDEWMAGVYAGKDGGYWIAPLTGRRTWPPPVLYGLGATEYITRINDVARQAMADPTPDQLYALLRDSGITYVYLGRYGGALSPEKLLAGRFQLVYHQEGVRIFRLEQ